MNFYLFNKIGKIGFSREERKGAVPIDREEEGLPMCREGGKSESKINLSSE
jgi:hypothetical protein